MSIPTYDGSGDAVHPSVVVFDEPWNGYRYWMAMTPYPNSDSAYENPSILASNSPDSGWEVPDGLTNPIEAAPGAGYHSDPELIYSGGMLHCIFRLTSGTDTLYLKSSADGVTWSAKTSILTGAANELASPAAVWDGSQWVMWVVALAESPNKVYRRTAADLEGPWSAAEECTIPMRLNREPWHIGVLSDPRGGFTMLLHTSTVDATGGGGGELDHATSDDGETWTVALHHILTRTPPNRWDDDRVYRASGHWIDANTMHLWYSAAGTGGWSIGYTVAHR